MDKLPDIQNTPDNRGKGIERVGVKGIHIPLRVKRQKVDSLPDVVGASIDMYVNANQEMRGINMSRCPEVLAEFSNGEISMDMVKSILIRMRDHLKADDAYIQIKFPYFMLKTAPVSGKQAPLEYFVTFMGRLRSGKFESAIQVEAYVTNLCPCSKEISFPKGAHNQRAHLTAKIVPNANLWWIEDIVKLLEDQASCPIFPILKRPDEKWVTETAYDNPKFVEDLVRDIAIALDNNGIIQYSIKAEAEESIHIHNAVAYITKDWNLG